MINRIIDGICSALNDEFGDEYEIYTETIKQGLHEPCFLIKCINPTQKRFLGKRYYKTNSFCIHYFPSSCDTANEFNNVCERLFNALEYINVDGDLTEGTDMSAETDDTGVLNFTVSYNMFVRKADTQTMMTGYDYINRMKG